MRTMASNNRLAHFCPSSSIHQLWLLRTRLIHQRIELLQRKLFKPLMA